MSCPNMNFPEESEVLTTPRTTDGVEQIPSNGAGHGRATFLPGGDRAARAGFKQLVRSAQFEARNSTKVRSAVFAMQLGVISFFKTIYLQFGCSWKP